VTRIVLSCGEDELISMLVVLVIHWIGISYIVLDWTVTTQAS